MTSIPKTSQQEKNQDSFAFNGANQKKVKEILSHYPKGREVSAVLPLLHLAQKQNEGWLSQSAMEHVACVLDVHPMRVHEVATFYTMFHLSPVGKNVVQICRTASCWLRGADQLTRACQKKLKVDLNEKTADGLFTVQEVECLGACVNAPVAQINDYYYENLDEGSLERILDQLAQGHTPPPGPQTLQVRPEAASSEGGSSGTQSNKGAVGAVVPNAQGQSGKGAKGNA
ncbi:MAG: NADH-quinone oxidoreductase subunit NuoE [bacterium]|nr:NADH-quinone oxidoreductase subunit NuoE [bacterium]